MSDLIYQIMWDGAWCDISPNLYKEHPARIRRIIYPAAAYEALKQELDAQVAHTERQSKFIVERSKELEALQKENAELKGEVKEWLCLDCNTVFPSESVPNSFSCLICPKCDGKRLPKNTAIIKVLREEYAAQAKRITELEEKLKYRTNTTY